MQKNHKEILPKRLDDMHEYGLNKNDDKPIKQCDLRTILLIYLQSITQTHENYETNMNKDLYNQVNQYLLLLFLFEPKEPFIYKYIYINMYFSTSMN